MDLSGNHIDDTGTQYLANVLQNNATITELNISNNEISDVGVQYLADMLRNNTTITKMKLTANKSKYCEAIGITIGIRNDKVF
ncbi:unnamed protein product [Adineta steineri]|uniref:Uncharacterized protein n=1 Tax=Adineta steineri TaxID=433720 RepID=A0A814XF54_9BILA|nr:unnamed protein product [Adineta steineri]